MLDIRLFGQFYVDIDGKPIDIPSRPAQSLLAYLVLNPGKVHRREKLAGLIWQDATDENSRRYLRTALWRIRKSLGQDQITGEDFILADKISVTFNDRTHFKVDANTLANDYKGEPCPEDLIDDLSLFGGELLPGFYDDWVVLERERLNVLFERKIQRLLDCLTQEKRWSDVFNWGERWIVMGHTLEPAYRAMMLAHVANGDTSGMVAIYQRCCQSLLDDLGVVPSQKTRDLYDYLLTGGDPIELLGDQRLSEKPEISVDLTSVDEEGNIPTIIEAGEITAGTLLNNRYLLNNELGHGGMGVVYQGYDNLLGRAVAVKILNRDFINTETAKRLMNEAQAIARINHRNIVSIYDAGESNGLPFIVMELLEGESLINLIPMPVDKVLDIVYQICNGLRQVHDLGIVHRDLKPENIMITPNGHAKLMDFGLSRTSTSRLTQEGQVTGTVFYLSPEQVLGKGIDQRSDLYALGVMLYELTTGELPFEFDDLIAVITQHLHAEVTPPRSKNPEIPKKLDSLIISLLNKHKEDRPTITEVQRELDDMISPPKVFRDDEIKPDLPTFLRQEPSEEIAEKPPFVARENELTQLFEFLNSATANKGHTVFVVGGPGLGKTALVTEFVRLSMEKHADLLVAIGRCSAYSGNGDPFLPFRDIFSILGGDIEAHWTSGMISSEHALRLWNNIPLMIKSIVSRGPDLIDVLISGDDLLKHDMSTLLSSEKVEILAKKAEQKDLDVSEVRQFQLFEQCVNVLKEVANKKPLMLILDDLHWADAGSINLLFHLGKRISKFPILIIGTYRPALVAISRADPHKSLESILNEFKREFGDVFIDLGTVQSKENREFVNAYINLEPNELGEKFRRALFEHTNGHPLFTIELLRDMQDRGVITKDQNNQWVASSLLDWSRLPARLEGVIGERIERLDESIHKLLEVACVEGQNFTAQVIAEVLDIDEYHVLRTLSRELEKRHRLVQELNVIVVNEKTVSRYKFSHILYQTYLYNKLSVSERRLLHKRIANTLENLYAGQIEEIAVSLIVHYDKVGNTEKTIHYLQIAADRAYQQYAYHEVIDHIGRALSMMPDGVVMDTPATKIIKARSHIRVGQAYLGLGQYNASKEHLNEALKLLDRPIPKSTSKLLLGISRQLVRQFMHRLFPSYFLNRKLVGHERDLLLDSAQAYSLIGDIYFIANEMLPTIYTVMRTLNLSERAGPSRKLAEAYALMGIGTGLVPMHRVARWYRDQAEEVAREINHPPTQVRVALVNGIYDIGIGRWEHVKEETDAAIIVCESIGDRRQWEECVANQANNSLLKGEISRSEELCESLLFEARRRNNMLHLVWGLEGLANHKLRYGETDQAVELLEEALLTLPKDVDQITEFEVYGLLSAARVRLNNISLASDAAESAMKLINRSPTAYSMFQGYTGIAEVYLHLWSNSINDSTTSTDSYEYSKRALQAIKHFRSYARIFPIGKPMALRFEGIYYWLKGKSKKAHNVWTKSLAIAEQLEMPYEIGLAHYELGSHDFGDEMVQRNHLELAANKFNQLGATYDLSRVKKNQNL